MFTALLEAEFIIHGLHGVIACACIEDTVQPCRLVIADEVAMRWFLTTPGRLNVWFEKFIWIYSCVCVCLYRNHFHLLGASGSRTELFFWLSRNVSLPLHHISIFNPVHRRLCSHYKSKYAIFSHVLLCVAYNDRRTRWRKLMLICQKENKQSKRRIPLPCLSRQAVDWKFSQKMEWKHSEKIFLPFSLISLTAALPKSRPKQYFIFSSHTAQLDVCVRVCCTVRACVKPIVSINVSTIGLLFQLRTILLMKIKKKNVALPSRRKVTWVFVSRDVMCQPNINAMTSQMHYRWLIFVLFKKKKNGNSHGRRANGHFFSSSLFGGKSVVSAIVLIWCNVRFSSYKWRMSECEPCMLHTQKNKCFEMSYKLLTFPDSIVGLYE